MAIRADPRGCHTDINCAPPVDEHDRDDLSKLGDVPAAGT
jgi:hypothetical protein